METVKQVLSLAGKAISLNANDVIIALTKKDFYPRAYDLRQSINNCTPVFIDGQDTIVYEIKEDCEDHYPRYNYISYRQGEFCEIIQDDSPAVTNTNEGIFFVDNRPDYLFKVSGVFHATKKNDHIASIANQSRFKTFQ